MTGVCFLRAPWARSGLLLALAGLLAAGCATNDVNPSRPRPQAGYVDLYSAGTNTAPLSWDVEQLPDNAQRGRKVFYELDPVEDQILRLAFMAGHCRLRVTFLNRAIAAPAIVDVEVVDGMVTPVEVKLVDAGTIDVEQRERSAGASYRGRPGRRAEYSITGSRVYDIVAETQAPVSYAVKAEMPYARPLP